MKRLTTSVHIDVYSKDIQVVEIGMLCADGDTWETRPPGETISYQKSLSSNPKIKEMVINLLNAINNIPVRIST
jgi:hypothetical protein